MNDETYNMIINIFGFIPVIYVIGVIGLYIICAIRDFIVNTIMHGREK